jgi:L-ascorbate metabolism protein UlaG (beta-lactamase superfamily)
MARMIKFGWPPLAVLLALILGVLFWYPSYFACRFPKFAWWLNFDNRTHVTFLGVTSLLIDDGCNAIMIDGFFSRPDVSPINGFASLQPNESRIVDSLHALRVSLLGEWTLRRTKRLRAVIVNHSHYDHAMDSPIIAQKTGAKLVGSESVGNIAEGYNLGSTDGTIPPLGFSTQDFVLIQEGVAQSFGGFNVTLVRTGHLKVQNPLTGADVVPYDGTIGSGFSPPQMLRDYKEGGTFAIFVARQGKTIMVQGSAGFSAGALANHHADVAYIAIGGLSSRPSAEQDSYWDETVATTTPQRIFPIHADNLRVAIDWQNPSDPPLASGAQDGIDFLTAKAAAANPAIEIMQPHVGVRIYPFP